MEAVNKKPREAQCINFKDSWGCILGGLLHLSFVGNGGWPQFKIQILRMSRSSINDVYNTIDNKNNSYIDNIENTLSFLLFSNLHTSTGACNGYRAQVPQLLRAFKSVTWPRVLVSVPARCRQQIQINLRSCWKKEWFTNVKDNQAQVQGPKHQAQWHQWFWLRTCREGLGFLF